MYSLEKHRAATKTQSERKNTKKVLLHETQGPKITVGDKHQSMPRTAAATPRTPANETVRPMAELELLLELDADVAEVDAAEPDAEPVADTVDESVGVADVAGN